MTIEQMTEFVEACQSNVLFKLYGKRSHPAIKDTELQIIDSMLDDRIINKLLAPKGYTPASRDLFPCNLLRAEMLKAIKYPEISYRKFCGDDKRYKNHKVTSPYIGMESKQNRAFIGLALNRKQMIDHVQMSQFRSSLSYTQLINLNVYFLYLLQRQSLLGPDEIHFIDSTELAVDRQQLLAKIKIGKTNIRIYDDIDCDCGKRRNKRDKSVYVVGYRMHTLAAIDPDSGHSIPLISVLAPANHHDSHFMMPLINLGQAIGLDLKLITADEAYHDSDGSLLEQTGVHLVAPPNKKVALPSNVETDSLQVTCDDLCEIGMEYVGSDPQGHEFKCAAEPGQCA
ncbi:MAG: transposase, partial [Hyphomicrobiales bacterium]|nr:transposase [Hyphomicrobiales bacterium]